jgi:hypothetical protein
MPFSEWLAATDRIETFVMTHRESYGYSVLDMFARGTRVLCPAAFVPRHFKDGFYIDTFEMRGDLIEQLRLPPDPLQLAANRASLSRWEDLVTLIDDRFRQLLRRQHQKRYRPSLNRAVAWLFEW